MSDSRLTRELRLVRERLIQTGSRNRLVHTLRFSTRSRSIDVVDERSDDVFRILVAKERRMRFDHSDTDVETVDESEPVLRSDDEDEEPEGDHFTDERLQTRHNKDKLQKKLLSLAREAKTLEEEQGINALYLALGFLRWFEAPDSESPREAPLILIPVSLTRNSRKSTYDLELRGEDIATNEPLKYRLRDDFGISLPQIPEDEGWTPSTYFAAVRECVEGRERWEIDTNGIQLGFFSFAKLLMVRDLEPENWPNESILSHPIVAGLLSGGFDVDPPIYPDTERLDDVFAPIDLIHVVDADASQTRVIETVRRGRNLVVKGPPGTGKSQTITNIIASAIHDGKTVLFMAEKMAALNVVHSRLVNAGLRDMCLELHSRSANKRLVALELGRTLESTAVVPATTDNADEITSLRNELNRLAETTHSPIAETDVTPYRAVSTLVRLRETGFDPVDFTIPGVENWSVEHLRMALETAAELGRIVGAAGNLDDHPFRGVRRTDLLPTDIVRLRGRLDELNGMLSRADHTSSVIAESIGLASPTSTRTNRALCDVLVHISVLSSEAARYAAVLAAHGGIDRARALAEAGLAIKRVAADAQTKYRTAALSTPVTHLGPMLASGHSFFGRFGSRYRTASAELASLLTTQLPNRQPERIELLNGLIEWQLAERHFIQFAEAGRELLGDLWQERDTDFAALAEAAEWTGGLIRLAIELNAVKAVDMAKYPADQLCDLSKRVAVETEEIRNRTSEVAGILDLDPSIAFGINDLDDVPLGTLADKARVWRDNLNRLDEWGRLLDAYHKLAGAVGKEITLAAASGGIEPEELISTIRSVHAETLYRLFAAGNAEITRITSDQKAALVGAFQNGERQRWKMVSRMIRSGHAERMPRGARGNMEFIRGEVARKRGHRPLRTVMNRAGPTVQRIKPVFLMSPISVAQYLPPGEVEFDLLVIDEASQVRPEEAIGAIGRVRQIVVVGDRQQLPPTSFFDRLVADGGDADEDDDDASEPVRTTGAAELESILTLCEARGLNSRMLEWHYRSRHPSLIEVSNEHFYDGKLVLFPSPASGEDTDGLHLRRVNGAYDRGGKRHNAIEAETVARAVAEHAGNNPERTLGVVTFSTAQRDQVTFWLDLIRQKDDELDLFMRGGAEEEFFVKNIENVQGDERDVIFISVGYGPRIAGHRLDSMAFGPVSQEGGERRLNVLFTRARYKTEVFASFDSGDIDLARVRGAGPGVLKHYLYAAETGHLDQPRALGDDPDSDFEITVAHAIRMLGYEVDHQVGSAGYRIDLAVRHPEHPGRYLLAVECDGATYHSALWARERDRQRQEVLEGLGWRFHRVWSTDWFHRRSDEFERLQNAIERAQTCARVDPTPALDVHESEPELEIPAPEDVQAPDLPDYEIAEFPVRTRAEPHEVPLPEMSKIVERVIDIEGPVHQEEVARRVAALIGKQRAGARIAGRVEAALRYLGKRDERIICTDDFWLNKTRTDDMPLRNRSRALWSLRKASLIPPMEIEAAIERVLTDNGALDAEDIPRAVALLFGFQRTGQEFRPAVEPIVDAMLARGDVNDRGAGIVLTAETTPTARV